jgi:hypothetical protein
MFNTEPLFPLVSPPSDGVSTFPPEFPTPGTPEWGLMNRRRVTLILKEGGSGLTAEETQELDFLQNTAAAALEANVPSPSEDLDKHLDEIEARLLATQEPAKETQSL